MQFLFSTFQLQAQPATLCEVHSNNNRPKGHTCITLDILKFLFT
jgi:hypothetical protein